MTCDSDLAGKLYETGIFLLDGVFKGNLILFSLAESSSCSDSAPTTTGCVLRGVNCESFALTTVEERAPENAP